MYKNVGTVGAIVLTLIALFTGCNSSNTVSPSEVERGPNTIPSISDSVGNSGPDRGVGSSEPTQCEIIDIQARRVLSVSATEVTLRVLAGYSGPGTVRVRIIDVRTGRHIGDYPLGDITLSVNGTGEYHWYVFVEVVNDGSVIQCDGSVSFEVKDEPREPECIPEFTYREETELGEWGECIPDEGEYGTGIESRFGITYTFEKNSCTGEEELVDETQHVDERECYIPEPCYTVSNFKEHRISSSNSWNNYYRTKCEDKGGVWFEQFYHSKGDKCVIEDGPTSTFYYEFIRFEFKGTEEVCPNDAREN